jgi:hypothetical protein
MIKITDIKSKGWVIKPSSEYRLYGEIEKLMRKEGYQGKIVTTKGKGSVVIEVC